MTGITTAPKLLADVPLGGLVPGTRVGFGPHAGAGTFAQPGRLPASIVDKVPSGPLRYRAGDPLAVVTLDGSANGVPSLQVEAYTQWKGQDDLLHVKGSLRDALKLAFRQSKGEQAQAVLQAREGGSYWVAQLSDLEQKPLKIDGKSLRGVRVSGEREETELLAIIGKDAVLNFSDQKIRKPHWWDPILG